MVGSLILLFFFREAERKPHGWTHVHAMSGQFSLVSRNPLSMTDTGSPVSFVYSYNYFIDTDRALVQISTSLQLPTTMVDIGAALVDIPRTQGALLLGGLVSAGYALCIQNNDLDSSRSVPGSQVSSLYKLSSTLSSTPWTFRSSNFWCVFADFAFPHNIFFIWDFFRLSSYGT